MYDVNKGIPDQQNLINSSAGVVTDPQIAVEYQKMALQKQHQQQEEQDRIDAASQAQLNTKLAKIGNAIDPIEQADIGKKQAEFMDIVTQNTPKLHSKNVNERIAANVAVSQAEANLRHDVDASNARYRDKVYMQHTIDNDVNAGTHYMQQELDKFKEASKQSYVNTPDKSAMDAAPTKNPDVLGIFKSQYQPDLEKEEVGITTPLPATKNENGQQVTGVKIDKTANYNADIDAMLKRQEIGNYVNKFLTLTGNKSNYTATDANGKEVVDYHKALADMIPFNTVRTKYNPPTNPQQANAYTGGGAYNPDKQVYVSEKVTPEGDHELTSNKPLEKNKVNQIEVSGTVKGDKGAVVTNQSIQPSSLKFVNGKNGQYAEIGIDPVGLDTDEGKALIKKNIQDQEDLDDLIQLKSKATVPATAALYQKKIEALQGEISQNKNVIKDASTGKIIVVPKTIEKDGEQVSNPSYKSAEALWTVNHNNKTPQDFFNEKSDKTKSGVINFSRDKSDAPAQKVNNPAPANTNTKPIPLKVGDIQGGYKYLGGDTKNPKSWQKQ